MVACKKCGVVDDYTETPIIFKNNTKHIEARCNSCGSFIKYMPQDKEAKFFFGKYKDQLVSDVKDQEYLQWFFDNVKTSDKMVNAVSDQIAVLADSLRP